MSTSIVQSPPVGFVFNGVDIIIKTAFYCTSALCFINVRFSKCFLNTDFVLYALIYCKCYIQKWTASLWPDNPLVILTGCVHSAWLVRDLHPWFYKSLHWNAPSHGLWIITDHFVDSDHFVQFSQTWRGPKQQHRDPLLDVVSVQTQMNPEVTLGLLCGENMI